MLRSHDLRYNEFRMIINVEHYFMENKTMYAFTLILNQLHIFHTQSSHTFKRRKNVLTRISVGYDFIARLKK